MGYVRSIPVRDAKGAEVILYEFQDRRFLKKVRRMKLDTGELVEAICNDTFVVVSTGERLVRISGG